MNVNESKDQSKGLRRWIILGLVLLIAGVLAVMLCLKPKRPAPVTEDPQTSSTTEKQDDPQNAVTIPTTDGAQSTNPGTEPDLPNETTPNDTPIDSPGTQPTQPGNEQSVSPEQQMICEGYSLFSGAFVEDGSDEPVENVAAILVTNGSDQYLDLAQVIYDLDGREAVFMVTGLPAGGSAWVLENSRMTATADSQFIHKNTVTSFRTEAQYALEGINLEFNGTMLKATNTSDRTFKALTVYYKTLHTDGNFLGGITYMTTFGDLEPGQSAEKLAGHYQPDKTQIVRIGYQEN